MTSTIDKSTFLGVLMRHLVACREKSPEMFSAHGDILEVFRGFAEALSEGTYSRHAEPIKRACKELGIKCDRATIDQVFKE